MMKRTNSRKMMKLPLADAQKQKDRSRSPKPQDRDERNRKSPSPMPWLATVSGGDGPGGGAGVVPPGVLAEVRGLLCLEAYTVQDVVHNVMDCVYKTHGRRQTQIKMKHAMRRGSADGRVSPRPRTPSPSPPDAAAASGISLDRAMFERVMRALPPPPPGTPDPKTTLPAAEYAARLGRAFALFDRDGSGDVDFLELAAGLTLLCARGGGGGGGAGDGGAARATALFALFDTDRSGTVSQAECAAFLRSVFRSEYRMSAGSRAAMDAEGVGPDELAGATAEELFADMQRHAAGDGPDDGPDAYDSEEEARARFDAEAKGPAGREIDLAAFTKWMTSSVSDTLLGKGSAMLEEVQRRAPRGSTYAAAVAPDEGEAAVTLQRAWREKFEKRRVEAATAVQRRFRGFLRRSDSRAGRLPARLSG